MKVIITHPNLHSVTDSSFEEVSLQNLASLDDSSCTAINLADCMDYVPSAEREKLLSLALSKLRFGGEIYISGTDALSVSHQLTYGQINIAQFNTSIFEGRLSCSKVDDTINYLKNSGIEIDNVKLDGLYYSVKAKRVQPHA